MAGRAEKQAWGGAGAGAGGEKRARVLEKEAQAGEGTRDNAPSELVRALEAIEVDVARRIVPAQRAVMLRLVSKSIRAAMGAIKPAGMIKVKGRQGEEEVSAGLVRMMQWCRITILILSGTGWTLGTEGMERFAAVLLQCPSFAYLDLGCTSLGAEGAGRLAAVLPQCPSLAHLDLSGNGIEDEGAGRLAAVLPQYPSLAHLYLSGNELGDEGERRLAGVRTQCPWLELAY